MRLRLRETFNEEKRFQLSEHVEVGNCWEAGRNRFWVPWFLEAIGVQSYVVASASMKVRWSRSPLEPPRAVFLLTGVGLPETV